MKHIRTQIQQQRLALTVEQKANYSGAIAQKLFALPVFKNSKNIACYLACKNEVDTQAIIETIWYENKDCYLPIINPDKTLSFALYTPETKLTKNKLGIQEPNSSLSPLPLTGEARVRAPEELDLVITPLVAFSRDRFRVGWGLGHYDRTFNFLLKQTRPTQPLLLGLAYNFQLSDDVKVESWDVPLDIVVTETEIY